MTNPAAALAERLRRTMTGVESRIDRIERLGNAAELNLPIEQVRKPGGSDLYRIRGDWPVTAPSEPPKKTERIEMADLQLLGSAFGWTFLRRDAEREVRLDSACHPGALNDLMGPTRVFVHQLVKVPGKIESLGDRLMPSTDHKVERWYRATLVPTGTYQAERKRQERAAAARKPRPLLSVRPYGWPLGRELLPWLRQRGIELSVVDGRLLVSSHKATLDMLRTAIADHAPLLLGWLTDARHLLAPQVRSRGRDRAPGWRTRLRRACAMTALILGDLLPRSVAGGGSGSCLPTPLFSQSTGSRAPAPGEEMPIDSQLGPCIPNPSTKRKELK